MLTHSDFDEFVIIAQREGIDTNKTPLKIQSKCHPESGCTVHYIGKGILKVTCHSCDEIVEYVKVGEVE